jgi:hypothetical protein
LDVSHTDAAWSVLARRLMVGDRTQNVAKTKLTYSNIDLVTQLIRTVQVARAGAPSSKYTLPIVVALDTPGSESRTYYGYDFMDAAEAAKAIMDAEGGPDVDFKPVWGASGAVLWEARVGKLTGPGYEFNFKAPEPGARGLWLQTDATEMANFVVAVGEGTEVDTLVRVASDVATSEWPARERVVSFKDVKSGSELQSLANEELRQHRVPTRQAGLQMLASGKDHQVSDLVLGGTVRWYTLFDPYLSSGFRDWELVKFTGDLGDWVTLEFQQRVGAP